GGTAHAGAGVGRRARRGRAVSLGGVGAQPALLRARARRAAVHLDLQLHQALHSLVAPVARPGRRDRDAGGLSGRHRTVERAVVAARGRRAGGDVLGGGVRRVLRAAGRGLRPGRTARVTGGAAGAAARDPRGQTTAWARPRRAAAVRDRRGA